MFERSKILNNDEQWYDEIDPKSIFEKQLEKNILSRMKTVYPNYRGIPFSLKITNPLGETSKPDLALIRNDYKEWYIIEVELSHQSWDSHVEKQVRVFTQGLYDPKKIAEYISSKDDTLNISDLEKMINNYSPKVMVIVNEKMPFWEEKIKGYGAVLSIFQIYRGTNGEDVYRVAGYTPIIIRKSTHCEFIDVSRGILLISDPIIKEANNCEIEITFNRRVTNWIKKETKGKVYLVPKGGYNPLPVDKKYALVLSDSDEYFLKVN